MVVTVGDWQTFTVATQMTVVMGAWQVPFWHEDGWRSSSWVIVRPLQSKHMWFSTHGVTSKRISQMRVTGQMTVFIPSVNSYKTMFFHLQHPTLLLSHSFNTTMSYINILYTTHTITSIIYIKTSPKTTTTSYMGILE